MTVFGERFKFYRLQASSTQKELAEVFAVAATTVTAWESGQNLPRIEKLLEIADYFGVTPNDLLGYGKITTVKPSL